MKLIKTNVSFTIVEDVKTFGLTVSQVHILCKGVNRMAKAIDKDIIKLENNEVENEQRRICN